jgi:hypothetical protein
MFRQYITICLCLSLAVGCERRRETEPRFVVEEECDFVIAVILDLSGSFLEQMTEGGEAHRFMLSLIDRYFRDRIGSNDQIIIAQISGTLDHSLVWQGTPLQLRKDFSSPRAFSDFLRSKADPDASHVHGAITQTIEYLMSQPSVTNGKAKSAVFALTDMFDNGPHPQKSKNRAVQALAEYGKIGGTVGLFYVDQGLVPAWRSELQKTGLTFRVEPEFRRPTLPSFE